MVRSLSTRWSLVDPSTAECECHLVVVGAGWATATTWRRSRPELLAARHSPLVCRRGHRQVRPDHECHIVFGVVSHERVEPREFAQVVVHRGVPPKALILDAVSVFLAIGIVGVLDLHAVEPLLPVIGVQDVARDQCPHPRSQVVCRGDDAPRSSGVGGVLVCVVDGLECPGPCGGRHVCGVLLVNQCVGRPSVHIPCE